jgi:carboxypeptidase family protein
MNTRFFSITTVAVFSLLVTPTLRSSDAVPSALEGTVRDGNWNPIKNAIVRIEAKQKFPNTTRTDANGHYSFDNLDAGIYRVTLLVDGKVKASINNATTKSGEMRRLNFDLTGRYGARATHLVYLPDEKASHLGGHWVDVDGLGRTNNVSVDNIQTLSRFNHSDNTGVAPDVRINPPENHFEYGVAPH